MLAHQYITAIRMQGAASEVAITIYPTSDVGTLGVASSTVHAVADDGRSLEFSLPLIDVSEGYGISIDNLQVLPCTPDASSGIPEHEADCVAGAGDVDVSYAPANVGNPLELTTSTGARTPFAAGLLLDQSRATVAGDPWDARLFGAKYFLINSTPTDHVALAAFASDDATGGEVSLLPQRPMTIFPVSDPQFGAPTRDLFATIDSLGSFEGGVSSFYESVGALLDFTAVRAPVGGPRSVVVVTYGRDETCGAPANCLDAERAILAKSRAYGVSIVTVGIGDDSDVDGRALSRLAEGSGGVAFRVDEPAQLGKVFGVLPAVLGTSVERHVARFRIESSTPGAFQPGRRVIGTLQFEVCPWDCYLLTRPFTVQIP
ncbi:MAG: VWA domain-containing protein [Gammaproteobacteria bacterium]|nr:VWA domain-containing protein [Gammaproteobacteria bacterium]